MSNLPRGWRYVSIAKLATEVTVGFVGKMSDQYVEYGIPFLRSLNVQPSRISLANIKYVSEAFHSKIAKSTLLPGDVVIVRTGKPGTAAVVPNSLQESNCSDLVIVRCGQEITNKYLVSYLNSISESDAAIHFVGAAQQHFNVASVKRIKVSLPSLDEQHAIVEILDTADVAVRKNEALVKAKTEYKRALAEELLTGGRRFAEFADTGAWSERALGEFFRERSERFTGSGEPTVLSCSKIYGIIPQRERFTKQLASSNLSRYKWVEPGDLVLDPMLLWDASINFSRIQGVVSPAYFTFQFVGADALPDYFHHLLYTKKMRHLYVKISQGTNTRRKKAPASAFLQQKVLLPSLPEQQHIAECLSLMDEEIRLLQQQGALLKKQKQGLMQRLLTGEVRVPEFRDADDTKNTTVEAIHDKSDFAAAQMQGEG